MEQQRSARETLQRIANSDDLQSAIVLLEERKERQEKELYEIYHRFQSGLTPQSILRSALYEIRTSPPLRKDLFKIALGLGAGYLSKRMIIAKKGGLPRQILGRVLEYGIAGLISAFPAKNGEEKQNLIGKLGVFLKKLTSKTQKV